MVEGGGGGGIPVSGVPELKAAASHPMPRWLYALVGPRTVRGRGQEGVAGPGPPERLTSARRSGGVMCAQFSVPWL